MRINCGLTVHGLVALAWLIGAVPGCNMNAPSPPAATLSTDPAPYPIVYHTITLATTTSTQDSGLLDVLLPRFRAATGIEVKVVAVGSGQAMELGRRGDADVLMVHSPEAEAKFVSEGYAEQRWSLMYNDYVLIGPATDPARVRGIESVIVALQRISAAHATFVSRADQSGTHAKEQSLWRLAGLVPEGSWYVRTGSGMAEALRVAAEKAGYTLADRATFLAQRAGLELEILVEHEDALLNHYSVISINRAKFPHLNHPGVDQFIEFLKSESARAIIEEFGCDKFGQPLFFLAK